MPKEKYPSEESAENLVGKQEKPYEDGALVMLYFKENRTFELHVNRKIYRCVGNTPVPFPAEDLSHPDFTDEIKSLFYIKE